MVPERTCIGCRTKRSAADLVRVVRQPDGSIAQGRTLPGRGAWLCAGSVECVETAKKRGAFERGLRGRVSTESVDRLLGETQGPPVEELDTAGEDPPL